MNTNPKLKDLLNNWHPQATLPANFKRGVWQRIEGETQKKSPQRPPYIFSRLIEWLSTPRYAVAISAIALLIGISTGYIQGTSQAHNQWTQLESKYADSINPLAPSHLMENR